jgi:hypothetical protein
LDRCGERGIYLSEHEHSNTSYLIVMIRLQNKLNRIGGIMVSMLASSAIDWVRAPVGQTKDYKIGICYFSAKRTALRRKSKDWLAWNQNNVE